MAEESKPSLAETAYKAKAAAEAAGEGFANPIADAKALFAFKDDITKIFNKIIRYFFLLVFGIFIFFFGIGYFAAILGKGGVAMGGETDSPTTGTDVKGDVEFWVTHYDPGQGGINGHNCGGAAIKVCLDSSSPTGYIGKYNGKQVSTGVIAVPQDSTYDRIGKVSLSEIPVPLIHTKVLEQAKIIIPGYNDSQATPVGDHFASTITKPNRLDLSCTSTQWTKVAQYWNKNKLALDSGRGLNGGTKIMGKIEGEVLK